MIIAPQNSQNRRHASEDNMLPMINVVFLLLIFFMLAGQASSDTDIQSPSSVSNLEQTGDLVLGINQQGQLNNDAGVLTLAHIPEWLANHPEAHIELRADADADSDRVIEVIDQLQQAGVEKIVLRTTHQ